MTDVRGITSNGASLKPIIGIAGFGIEGKATYEYFNGNAEIHIFDDKEIDSQGFNAIFHKGLSIPSSIQIVYKSPGIPTSKIVLESNDTRISTLIDIVLEKVGDRAIGVTGTKGKSTVASLIHHVLEKSGRDAVLYGNIGVADMQIIENDTPQRHYVIELSSYQCEHIAHSPHVAVLLNLYPEHLNHHGSFETYREAKLNIARFQSTSDIFINGSSLDDSFKGKVVKPDFRMKFETSLVGEHNQKNCAVAYTALISFGISDDEIRKHIATFKALPGRLENVGVHGGLTFYDDFLATIPQATLAAIEALPNVDTIILGGEDRGIPFGEFAKSLAKTKIQNFIIFLDTGSKMVTLVQDRNVVSVNSMEEAVRAAYEHTKQGGTVLLSNASPSFNLFKDYKDKSAQYRGWIERLGN